VANARAIKREFKEIFKLKYMSETSIQAAFDENQFYLFNSEKSRV